jgi:hypothetical protein
MLGIGRTAFHAHGHGKKREGEGVVGGCSQVSPNRRQAPQQGSPTTERTGMEQRCGKDIPAVPLFVPPLDRFTFVPCALCISTIDVKVPFF